MLSSRDRNRIAAFVQAGDNGVALRYARQADRFAYLVERVFELSRPPDFRLGPSDAECIVALMYAGARRKDG